MNVVRKRDAANLSPTHLSLSLICCIFESVEGKGQKRYQTVGGEREFRKEIAEALLVALNIGSVSEAINAAHLLSELRAHDALLALKSKA